MRKYENIFLLCLLAVAGLVFAGSMNVKSFLPEVEIVVDASCCAGVTPKTHEAALETMRMCQIDVV